MDKYIGNIVGQYRIIDKCVNKHKDGHLLYNGECIYCGYIKLNTKINDFKKKNRACSHYDYSVKWNNSRLHLIFNAMIERCYNISDKSYRFYGKKGITICDKWIDNPQLFNDWSMSNGYSDYLTIDRVDESKNYCSENCRWITREMNSKWKSITNKIEVNGILDSGKGWADRLGYGCNYINTMIRDKGIEYTIKFISCKLV